MAIPSGYTQSIRDGLSQKGVAPGSIGYNQGTGYVTVDGKDAIKSGKNYSGTNYATTTGFNSDWDSYQKSLKQPAVDPNAPVTSGSPTTSPATAPTTSPSYDPYKSQNPYDQSTNDLISYLLEQAKNPTPVDPNAIYNSPQWAAQQAQAQRGAQQGIRAAQESMGASGFGRSTALGERSQGIQNSANEYMNLQVLPMLMQQAAAEKQQALQNQFGVLDALTGQQAVGDNRFNSANNLAVSEGQLTGNYLSTEAKRLIDDLMGLKQRAETKGITREDRAGLSSSADGIRARLTALGIDNVDALFGANTNSTKANTNVVGAGVKTLGGKAEDRAAANDEFNQGITMAQLTGVLPNGKQTTAEQQRLLENEWMAADQTGVISDRLAKLYGLPKGTETRAAKEFASQLEISQQNADTAEAGLELQQDDNDRAWASLDYEMGQDGAEPSKYEGLPASQVMSGIKENYSEPILDEDGEPTSKTKMTTDKVKREQMFLDVVDSGLNDTETNQVLRLLGLTSTEIDSYTKKYSGN